MEIIYDASVVGAGMIDSRCRTGIFSVVTALLVNLARRKDLDILLFSYPGQEEGVVSWIKENLPDAQNIGFLRRENGHLVVPSGVKAFLSPMEKAPPEICSILSIRRFYIVYDLIALRDKSYMPDGDNDDWWLPRLINGLDGDDVVFTISNATKNDLLDYRKDLNPDNVRAALIAADPNRFYPCKDQARIAAARRKYGISPDCKYVFSLCTIEPRKNILFTVKSFLEFIARNHIEDLCLVLGGTKWESFYSKFQSELSRYGELVTKYIKQIGYVDDADLAPLYSGSLFLPYMSLQEGFGLPPLEAMQCGCPVITSNTTSLPEVVGDAGIMLAPDDMEGMVAAIGKYYFAGADEYAKYVGKSLERSRLFSWEKHGETVYNEIMRRAGGENIWELPPTNSKPRVSVISAVYNLLKQGRKDFFLQMADSVKAQDYPDVEHIVVDGGSKDGTREFLEAAAKEYGFKYISEPDDGVYFAMNKGSDMASGKYVAFLNSDDYWHDKHAVSASVCQLEKGRADFSYANAVVLNNGTPIYLAPLCIGEFFIRMPFCHQTMFTRKDVFLKLGGFKANDFRSAADFDFINRLILSGARGVYVPLNFTTYRLGGMSHVQQTNSETEVIRSICENSGAIGLNVSRDYAYEMYYGCFVKSGLIDAIREKVCRPIALAMDAILKKSSREGDVVYLYKPEEHLVRIDGRSTIGLQNVHPRRLPEALRKAKKLLYIGHAHHRKTHSTDFLVELLSSEYEVSRFDLDPDDDKSYDKLRELPERDYDVVVIFQLMPSVNRIREAITFRKGVFFPMYDYYQPVADVSKPIWQEYRDFLIVNFSLTVHREVRAAGFESRYIQYFPKPAEDFEWGDENSAFFWQRINQVNPAQIFRAMENIEFSHLHIHQVPDPMHTVQPVPKTDKRITTSKWFDTRDEMRSQMLKSAIYVAPRFYEGIGMGFLEAMANGRCVVSADGATMTEYITSGENGLLYDCWEAMKEGRDIHPIAKPKLTIRQLQKNAYDTICRGYRQWSLHKGDILSWIEEFSPELCRVAQSSGPASAQLENRQEEEVASSLPKRVVKGVLKNCAPYWLMRDWLIVKYGMTIDKNVFAYPGKVKRIKRIVKFMLPYGVVRILKKIKFVIASR